MNRPFIRSSFRLFLQIVFAISPTLSFCDNQTPTTTPVITNGHLPFQIEIKEAGFSLPNGIQSYVHGIYDGKWFFISGRTNGLHGFDSGPNNFPPNEQNRMIFVVDPKKKRIWARSIADQYSGLSQQQVDELSVTSAQGFQRGKTLYLIGGYGVDSSTGLFSTKQTLTAINLERAMDWMLHPSPKKKFSHAIRQTSHPLLKVTGGEVAQHKNDPVLLIFGQNFEGYYVPESDGNYTEVVRRFHIKDDGKKIHIEALHSKPAHQKAEYRRRDLNVVPIIYKKSGRLHQAHVALSGVFTETDGAWTVPVQIDNDGTPSMANPIKSSTFKQGMNNYACANIGLFSNESEDMYTILFGGISFGYFEGSTFQTDSEFPFINQVTAIKRNHKSKFSQYLLDAAYPVILSTASNPGNQLLFGAGADFIPADDIDLYTNGVVKLDHLKTGKTVTLGYIVGGIQSTLPNTNVPSDSAASPYIFEVTIRKTH